MASVCIATSTAIVLRFSLRCGIFSNEWVRVFGCLCIVNECIYSVWFWFVCSFFNIHLSHPNTCTHTGSHAQWCYILFYNGVEVFSQCSIGSCTYMYFVMTLASYDWIFVVFRLCNLHTRRTLAHTYNQIFMKRMFGSLFFLSFFYFLCFPVLFFRSHSM